MNKDMALANALSMKAVKLREISREEWKVANEHLAKMGSAIGEMHETHIQLAEVLKRLSK